ncbi:MAG TPA: TetR/AcrR family transcriptional regulator [Galbitalea sp.]|jgi:AcrR family transcriptional regulator
MPEAETPGLRERKRLATRQAIQQAVLSLALERGLEHVTVEEISRQADISPRTFFNYFVSKEAAIAGDSPSLIAAAEVDLFVSGGPNGNLLRDLGELVAGAADHASDSRDIVLLRRELHTRYPNLFALRMAGMKAFEDELAVVVERRLVHDDPTLAEDPVALASRARLVTLVAFGALRHAWTRWADSDRNGNAPLDVRLRESFDELESVLLQSTSA